MGSALAPRHAVLPLGLRAEIEFASVPDSCVVSERRPLSATQWPIARQKHVGGGMCKHFASFTSACSSAARRKQCFFATDRRAWISQVSPATCGCRAAPAYRQTATSTSAGKQRFMRTMLTHVRRELRAGSRPRMPRAMMPRSNAVPTMISAVPPGLISWIHMHCNSNDRLVQ